MAKQGKAGFRGILRNVIGSAAPSWPKGVIFVGP